MVSVRINTQQFMGDHSEKVCLSIVVPDEIADELLIKISDAKKAAMLPMAILPTDEIVLQIITPDSH